MSKILKRSFHSVIEYINKIVDVSDPIKLINLVIDNRNTPLFQVTPIKDFQYGIVDKSCEGSIRLHKYDSSDIVNVYYTFGIQILVPGVIDDTSLAVIIGYEGFSIMDKDDCKNMFEYTDDEKLNRDGTDLLLKRLKDSER